jgi:anti-anti-sigma regulatory factor
MLEEQLQIQLVSSSQDLQRLRISGALTEKHLQKSVHDPLELAIGAAAYAQRLLADLSKLNELDNAGLDWMLKTAARCQAAGGEIVFYALPSALSAIVEHSPGAAELKIADNEAAAALQLKGR